MKRNSDVLAREALRRLQRWPHDYANWGAALQQAKRSGMRLRVHLTMGVRPIAAWWVDRLWGPGRSPIPNNRDWQVSLIATNAAGDYVCGHAIFHADTDGLDRFLADHPEIAFELVETSPAENPRRRNMDEARRRSEREVARTGAPVDEVRALVERMRSGEIEPGRVALAAVLGDTTARGAYPEWRETIMLDRRVDLSGEETDRRLARVSFVASRLGGVSDRPAEIMRVVYERGAQRHSGVRPREILEEARLNIEQQIEVGNYAGAFNELRNLALLDATAASFTTPPTLAEAGVEVSRGVMGYDAELDAQYAELVALLLDRPLPPMRNTRRNMDERIRRLERAAAQGDVAAAKQLRQERRRTAPVKTPKFEKFIPWDSVDEQFEISFRNINGKRTLVYDDMDWALRAADDDTDQWVNKYERDNDVELSMEQREAVNMVYQEMWNAAAHQARIKTMDGLVDRVLENLNKYAKTEPTREHDRSLLPGTAVSWRVGEGPDGDQGVWIKIMRPFLYAMAELDGDGGWNLKSQDAYDVLNFARRLYRETGSHRLEWEIDPSREADYSLVDDDALEAAIEGAGEDQ